MDPAAPSPASSPSPAPSPSWPREPRRLAASRGTSWWGEGWRIFVAAPLTWIGIVVALVVFNAALGWIPVVGWLATTVLGPVFIGGLMLGCHALARGEPLSFSHVFAAFGGDRFAPLALLGAIAAGFSVACALVFAALFLGAGGMAMMSGMLGGSMGHDWAHALAGFGIASLIGGVLGIVAFAVFLMAWWFAPALTALNGATPLDALKASYRASMANLGAMFVFGLVALGLMLATMITMGLGLIVLAPVMIGATYASWREVFGD